MIAPALTPRERAEAARDNAEAACGLLCNGTISYKLVAGCLVASLMQAYKEIDTLKTASAPVAKVRRGLRCQACAHFKPAGFGCETFPSFRAVGDDPICAAFKAQVIPT